MTALRRQLSYANVMATIAVFIALGGGAYALSGKNTVASDDIINGQVKAEDIGGNQVKTADIAASQVTGGKVAADTLGSADIGASAVLGSEVGDGSLAGADIDDSTLFNDNSLNLLDIDEGSLYNDNSLQGADIDESTLFNDNSLTGTDINEASLVGLARGEGRTVIRGGNIALGGQDVINLAQGTLTFDCAGSPALTWHNGSGATGRMISSDRFVLNEEDDTVANNASLGVGNGLLNDGLDLAVNLSGTGALGRAEGAIITDEHIAWFHAYAFGGASTCDYAVWMVEDEI